MLRLRDIMTRDVFTLSASTSLQAAAELFADIHVGGAPVVEGGRVVGVVSMGDILALVASPTAVSGASEREDEREDDGDDATGWDGGAAAANDPSGRYFTDLWLGAGAEVTERMEEAAGEAWSVLSAHTVAEVMTRAVHALPSDADVAAAAAHMRAADVHRILVMDEGVLRGIVTTVDITRAVADGRLVRRTYVFGGPRNRRLGRGLR